jgi:hypothetical protein
MVSTLQNVVNRRKRMLFKKIEGDYDSNGFVRTKACVLLMRVLGHRANLSTYDSFAALVMLDNQNRGRHYAEVEIGDI